MPEDAIIPLESASDVLFTQSCREDQFSPQTFAQEAAFAQELAERGRSLAVVEEPDQIFEKQVMWFLPDRLVVPRLWDYSRQTQEFAAGLERQGNRVFCSSHEVRFWENKAHMHRALDEVGAPTPRTFVVTGETRSSYTLDFEPVLIKKEHSAGSAGIEHFATAHAAREYLSRYPFRPTESVIVQEVVQGTTRDLRLTMVGARAIDSTTYWRVKSEQALASEEWTTTATTYDSRVEHANIPDSVVAFASGYMNKLGIRTAGIDLMWPNDDMTTEPLVLELSPYYQPNPVKPARYDDLTYKQFKRDRWLAKEGYLAQQYQTFREIAAEILDQGLF